jgi:Bacterial Ig-like domain (group 1)/PKD domain
MLTASMVSRPARRSLATAVLAGLSLTIGACQKVPLLAPTGSTITVTAGSTALSVNGTTDITAIVLEQAGTAPQDGTVVTFTTTLGSIEPSEARTNGGRVTVKFRAGTANGTAIITASSGAAGSASTTAATNVARIAVGTAAVGSVRVSANPTLLPTTGGLSTITGNVIDINGNPLSSAPVTFSTTAGTLEQVAVSTDASGLATAVLRTTTSATVTVAVGAQAGSSTGTTPPTTGTPAAPTTPATTGTASGSVTVNVTGTPALLITAPAAGLTAGLPAAFTFAVTAATTNGNPIRDVTVDWGDGQSQNLGATTGTVTVSHVYRSPGSYVVVGKVTDTAGNQVTTSTSVTVTPPALTLTITPPSTLPSANLPATFIFAATAPTGDSVRNVSVDWGDGTAAQDLGAISGNVSVSHVFKTAGTFVITGTVTDVFGNSSKVSTSITVIPVPKPTIIITPSPVPGKVNTQTTLTIQVTLPSGISVQDLNINFGDGQQANLGGATSAAVPHVYTTTGTFTVTVTVLDTSGQTTIGTAAISIGP